MRNLKGTFFKLVMIIIIWGGLFFINRDQIAVINSNQQLSSNERILIIFRQLLGIDYREIDQSSEQIIVNNESTGTSFTPRNIDTDIYNTPNFIRAQNMAEQFNHGLNVFDLNQFFLQYINDARHSQHWDSLYFGEHLLEGSRARVDELTDYHYLSPYTIEGNHFRSHFPLEGVDYRIGENLYELYIATDDIHLQTWQNPEIFAKYLADIFESTTIDEQYQSFASAYLQVKASASDYRINSHSYVRIVVVLTLDTH